MIRRISQAFQDFAGLLRSKDEKATFDASYA